MATTRHSFDTQLRALEQDLLRMGSLVEGMVDQSVRALLERDAKLADVLKVPQSQVMVRPMGGVSKLKRTFRAALSTRASEAKTCPISAGVKMRL